MFVLFVSRTRKVVKGYLKKRQAANHTAHRVMKKSNKTPSTSTHTKREFPANST